MRVLFLRRVPQFNEQSKFSQQYQLFKTSTSQLVPRLTNWNHENCHKDRTRICLGHPAVIGFALLLGADEQFKNDRRLMNASIKLTTPIQCEANPIASKPFETRPKDYMTMVLKKKGRSDSGEEEEGDCNADSELEDVDPSWALSHNQINYMAIAHINANEQLEDRGVLQQLHTLNNGNLILAGVMDGHGGWQVGEFLNNYFWRISGEPHKATLMCL